MTGPRDHPLYQHLLGDDWHSLPPQLQAMHDVVSVLSAEGMAVVERGPGLIARVLAVLGRLPRAGQHVPLTVQMSVNQAGETWIRSFAGRRFCSQQTMARSREGASRLAEKVGPVTITFQIAFDGERLTLTPLSWRFLGLPLPRGLVPVAAAHEYVDANGRFSFFVEAAMPFAGLIVRYTGWLKPVSADEMDNISRS